MEPSDVSAFTRSMKAGSASSWKSVAAAEMKVGSPFSRPSELSFRLGSTRASTASIADRVVLKPDASGGCRLAVGAGARGYCR